MKMVSATSPAFIRRCVTDLLDEDGLLVIAKGLGVHAVLRELVVRHHTPEHLVFLLNTTQEEEDEVLGRMVPHHELA